MSTSEHKVIITAQDNATATIKKVEGNFAGIAGTVNKMRAKLEGNQETINKVGVASGVAFAGISLGIKNSIEAASNLNNSLAGLKSVVVGTGGDFDKAKAVIQKFTSDGLVSTENAATSLKNLIAKGFSLDEAATLMDRFKDSASFGRQSALGLGEAIRGATEGIKNENSMLVDNAGVTKNVSVMVTEYAKALGLKGTALTDAQKREAIYQGIVKETESQVGNAVKLSDEYSGQVAKLNAQQTQLAQTVGTILIPTFSSLLQAILPIVQTVSDWVKENPKLTQAIILGALAVTGLGTALLIIGPILAGVSLAITATTAVVSALGTALLFLAANPVGIVISALAILAVAAYAVYKNWDEIRPKLEEVWTTIGGTINYAVEKTKAVVFDVFDLVQIKVSAVTDWLANKVKTVLGFVDSIKNALASVGSNVSSAVSNVGNNVSTAVQSVAGARADGGPVEAGKKYLVGERGPEYFVPSQSGTIIPNGQTSGGVTVSINMGGVTVRSESDARSLAATIREELVREIQLAKLGIA